MTNTSPISINRLIDFRKRIDSTITAFKDPLIKEFFLNLINSLLLGLAPDDADIKKRGIYKAIILGMDDSSIVDQFVGVNTFGLTSNDNYYLVSICRTIREQSLQIDFTKNPILTEESKRVVASIFRQKRPTIDIDKFLANGKIPSLIVKIDLSFLENLDDDIKLLKATELIEKITLNVFFDSDNNVLSLCRQIDIFTSRYTDKLHSPSSLNIDPEFSVSDGYYNLVLLNGKNDYLIKYFLDLFSHYESKLKLDKLSRRSLENIFYTVDRDVIEQTRLLEEKPKYKEKIEGIVFSNEINKRHDLYSLLFILNCIQYYITSEIKNDSYTKDKIAHRTKNIADGIKGMLDPNELINKKKNGDISMQLKSTLHTIFNPENDKYVLCELSELLSSEILSIMIDR